MSAVMVARRTVFARLSSPGPITRFSALIPRRGLAGSVDHPRSRPSSPSKWNKGQSLVVSFAGCGLLLFGGYKLLTEASKKSAYYAEDDIPDVSISPKESDDSKDLKSITGSDSLMYLFKSWSKLNRKLYKSPEDKMRKFEVFKANVKYVEDRSKGFTEREVGLEHFPDLDREDFVQSGYLVGVFEWWIKEMKGSAYKSRQEKLYRFERFKETVKGIEEGNKNLSGFSLGLNPYADFNDEDWKNLAGSRISQPDAARNRKNVAAF